MRIVIAGGSLAGLFAAGLLRRAGHEVIVFERSRGGLAGRGAGLVPQEEVFTALRALGLDHLAAVGVVARERIFLDLDGSVAGRVATPQMQISWDHLYSGLRDLLGERDYTLGRLVAGAGQGNGAAWLEFEDGSRETADLVIGADGVGSAVRGAVIGMEQHARYTGYVAWRGIIAESALPEPVADILLDRFAFYTADRTQALGYVVPGPAGELDIGRRRYNWVWYRRADDLAATLTDRAGRAHPFSLAPGQLTDEARARLRQDSATLLPPQFRTALLAEPNPFVQAIFDYEAPQMIRGRLALVGDSAFVARPHTAMGVAKAAGDALALASALAKHSVEPALQAYQQARLRNGRAIVDYGRKLGAFMA
ncbi:FAD-dependent monooxygenase [Sphingomonas sp. H39-1-10]|uniref:FAD binding domain-containing protein n=1 Tax=Sphingomonas TaxID=13687 RepID=UPI00088545E4|nr:MULTISPECIES: FAD-dependent monooxygenase [Sphingomonas]MDF0488349.1 FAD-dependent monooxygenase [Sphingomonas pollutisoli]SDA36383.1 2-polyprenyl-6-methoxyphenol hydroxylase [Sphingomonas sp. NFR15]